MRQSPLARTTAIHRQRRGCEYIVAPPSSWCPKWYAWLSRAGEYSELWSQEPVKRERTTYRWWGPSGSRAYTGGVGTHKRDVNEFDTDILESEWKMAKHAQKTLRWQSRVWAELEKDRSLISDCAKRADPSIDWIGPTNISNDRISLGDGFECCGGSHLFIYRLVGLTSLITITHQSIDSLQIPTTG